MVHARQRIRRMSAPRPTWKGLLQISLVQIPIKVFPATSDSDTISFHQLHQVCSSRIHQKRWCDTCAKEVPSAEVVNGYEVAAGRYVVLSDQERDAAKPPSARIVHLTRFAAAASLDPVHIDRSYYLAPDGDRAAQAFAVVAKALHTRVDMVGIGTLAIYGREYLVAVRPRPPILLLHTLHPTTEIRDASSVGAVPDAVGVSLADVRVARQVIAALSGPLALEGFQDAQQAELRKVIAAKVAGDQIVVPVVESPVVIDLGEALRRSLEEAQKPKAAAKRKKAS
jgi:DNA end-binding protein Ku